SILLVVFVKSLAVFDSTLARKLLVVSEPIHITELEVLLELLGRSLQLLLGRPLKVTVEMGRDPLIPGHLGQQLSAVLLGLELRDLGVLLLKLLFEILSLLSLLIKLQIGRASCRDRV